MVGRLDPTASITADSYCAACERMYDATVATCPDDGSPLVHLPSEEESLTGRVIDERYQVRELLGRGGMGSVYVGWQVGTEREVAIKVIGRSHMRDREATRRFLREMRLAGRIQHPGVVSVHDAGKTTDGLLYLVMERVPGRTLASAIAEGPFPPARAMAITAQICDGLDAAHRAGIVHRDLKPANVMLVPQPDGTETAKLLDLGLAKSLDVDGDASVVTRDHTVLGTPSYMAPEQVSGLPCDARVDLYALGAILHEMVSGRPPFVARSVHEVMAMQLNTPPPRPDRRTPPRLGALIRRLLAKRPDERPPSAAAVRAELEPEMLRPGHRTAWIALAAIALTLAVGMIAWAAAPSGERRASLDIVIQTEPSGANVWFDGELVGVTPMITTHARGGEVVITIEQAGYLPYTTRRSFDASEVWINMALAPAPGSGLEAVAPE